MGFLRIQTIRAISRPRISRGWTRMTVIKIFFLTVESKRERRVVKPLVI